MTGSRLGLMLLATLLVWPTTVDAGQGEGHQLTFAKDVARIFQEKCQVCHQPRFNRADVAADLPRREVLGTCDQAEGGLARDATVAHRSKRRNPTVQERPVVVERADRHTGPSMRWRTSGSM